MTTQIDNKLFPAPSSSPAPTGVPPPRIWPGVSPASTTAVQEILTDNHKRWHVFFNDRGFHNHIVHTVLTLWALGADETILRKAYEDASAYQRPAFTSPNPVTKQNWKDFLGNSKYYQAYVEFFQGEIESSKNFSDVLQEYVFSTDANVKPGSNGTNPEMLNRFLAGLLHPMIHTAFGLEFSLPGVFAEGLAQTAVHPPETPKLLPLSWWSSNPSESLVSHFASAVGLSDKTAATATKKDTHAFTVLARILADPAIAPTKPSNPFGFLAETHAKWGDAIREYVDQWTLGDDLHAKADELIWTTSLIYAVGGSGKPTFNADFFHMHFVTSSLFLHTVLAHLPNEVSQTLFLRGYYNVVLAWYIGRGRPALDIPAFFANPATLLPSAPGVHPTPHESARPSGESPHAITPNPWLAIVQTTLTHPDDHVAKIQRALGEFAMRFGKQKGAFVGTELEGAEVVDGTLFLKAAGLTTGRLGWTREGDKPLEGVWDRHGFY